MQLVDALPVILTAVTGVAVFVIGQAISRFVLEPASQVRKALADISSLLLFRQRQITNVRQDMEISEDLRRVAAQLLAGVWMVPAYAIVRRLLSLPKKADALAACRQLNWLAYTTMPGATDTDQGPKLAMQGDAALTELQSLLNIPVRYEDRRPAP